MDEIIDLFLFLAFGGAVTLAIVAIFALSLEKFTRRDEDGHN